MSRRLFALGLALLALYLLANLLLPRLPGQIAPADATLIAGQPIWAGVAQLPIPIPQSSPAIAATTTTLTVLALAVYLLALGVSHSVTANRRHTGLVLGFATIYFVTSLLILPSGSHDLKMYVLYARVAAVHHVNPYATPPATFHDDRSLQYGDPDWSELIVPYGPVWTYLSSSWASLIGDDFAKLLLGFRLVLLGFNLASLSLIWLISRRLDPTRRLTALVFYAWNPIVVLKGQTHTEPVMVFFILLGVFLLQLRREWPSLVMLTLATLTKFIAAPLVLVSVLQLGQGKPMRRAVIGALLTGAIVVLAFLPVWSGWELLPQLARDPGSTEPGSILSLRWLILLPGLLATLLWLVRQPPSTLPQIVRGWGFVLLWTILPLPANSFSWYLLPLIAIASLIATSDLAVLTLVIAAAALLTNLLEQILKPYAEIPPGLLRLIWWGPPIVTSLWLLRAYLRSVPFFNRLPSSSP